MRPDPAEVLLDLLNAARRCKQFVEGVAPTEFPADELRTSAVIYQLLILGEAAKRMPKAYCDAHAEIPWSDMARMRDRLIHAYHAVDLEIVARMAYERIPEILGTLERLLAQETG